MLETYLMELNQARINDYLEEARKTRLARRSHPSQPALIRELRHQIGRRLVQWGLALAGYQWI
jgi:hypothetical protein